MAGLTSDSADFDGATLRTDLTQAAIDYRIAYGLNQARNGVKSLAVALPHMVLVVDGAMRQLTSADTVRTAGELFGWLYAHEFIHNLGLPDDFTGGPSSLLSTRGDTSLRPDDLKLLAMALDDPTLTAEDRKGAQTRLARLAELSRFDKADASEPRAAPGPQGPAQISLSPDASLITLDPSATAVVSTFGAAPALFSTFVPLFDWSLTGSASVTGGSVTIAEDSRLFSRAVRDFTVPADGRILTFRITDLRLGANDGPQDAFEVALLGTDGASVAGAIALTATDAALNVQAGGGVVASERTTISGRMPGVMPTPSAPWTVSIDLSHLPPGTVVRLYLDLLGFGALGSSVAVTDFAFAGRNINTAPVARDDVADVVEGGTVTIDARLNDSDADGDNLTLLLRDPPAFGTVRIAEGRFVYTPLTGYRGPDSFTYVVSDGTATSQPATVAITVLARQNRPPVALDDRASVQAGAVVDIAVLANDSDPDGNALAARIVAAPAHGLATLLSDGRIRYLADAGYAGPDSLVYEVDDGAGGTARATVALTIEPGPVEPGNRSPVALPDDVRVPAGGSARVEVLANDSDPDGDVLVAVLVEGPVNGSLTANPDGSFVYAAKPGFTGVDRFFYVANDGRSTSARTQVSIVVERQFRAPAFQPVPDAVIAEGETLSIDVTAIDPDNDPIIYELVSAPSGAAIDRATGRLTWAARDGEAIALFKVRATDLTGDTAADLDVIVRVKDVAPILDVAAPSSAVLGKPVTVVLSARDPGDDTIQTWAIDWGDGWSDVASGPTATLQHIYGKAGTYSIRVSAANEDGTFAADPRDIRMVSPYLEVSELTPLGNGFHLRFNQPLITESLNLYGTATGPYAASDLLVVDGENRPIAGSAVLDADGQGLTFVSTSPIPAGQVIRVLAFSGPDAFQSAAGPLDGDRDGVPGDDFIGMVQLGGPDVITRFASFISPSGGAIGESLGLPIDFSSVGGVRSLRFIVDFDPEVLEITRVVQAPGLPRGDVDFAVALLGEGRARLTVDMRFAAPLEAGSLRLAYLEGRTTSAVAYGSQRLLSTSVTAINGTALVQPVANGAVQVVALGNDANRDARVNGTDQSLIDQVGNRISSGFDAWRLIDPNLLILAAAPPQPPVTPPVPPVTPPVPPVTPPSPPVTPTTPTTPTTPVGGGGNPTEPSPAPSGPQTNPGTPTAPAANPGTPATPTPGIVPVAATSFASPPVPVPPGVGEPPVLSSPAVLRPQTPIQEGSSRPGQAAPTVGARPQPCIVPLRDLPALADDLWSGLAAVGTDRADLRPAPAPEAAASTDRVRLDPAALMALAAPALLGGAQRRKARLTRLLEGAEDRP